MNEDRKNTVIHIGNHTYYIGTTTVECACCHREYETRVINGHVDNLKLCRRCILDILKGRNPNA